MEHRKAFAYIRTNNKTQRDSDDSFNYQRAAINKYAHDNYITITNWFIDEAKSGGSFERDGLKSLLCSVINDPRAIDCVIVHSLSRISRTYDDYVANIEQTLDTHGIVLCSASKQFKDRPTDIRPSEMFMRRVQACMEQTVIQRELVKSNMLRRIKDGYSVHRPPLGYSASPTKGIYQKNSTGDTLSDYFKKTLAGDMSVSELRSAISRLRFPESEEPQSKQISSQVFKHIVSNPYYSGYVKSSGQQFKGLHTPLLSEEEQSKLKKLCNL